MRSHSKYRITGHQLISVNLNEKDGLQTLILRCCELLLVDKIDCLHYLKTSLTTLNLDHVFKFMDFHRIPGKFKHTEENVFELTVLCPVKEGDADLYISNPKLIRNNKEVDGNDNTDYEIIGVKSLRERSNEIESDNLFND